MSKLIFAALFAVSSLFSVNAAAEHSDTRNRIQLIEQEYARQHDGEMIPDDQLEYYLDQSNDGWSMSRISQDMADAERQYTDNNWRPRDGWVAEEVVCSSINSQYRECSAPFRSTAVITQQISQSACVQGRSWGQKPGVIWVNQGCRARFGIVAGSNPVIPVNPVKPINPDYSRIIVCQSNRGRYHQCNTGFRGRVQLVKRLNNSAACVAGRSWGQREGMIWVSRGCRAQFASVNRLGRGDNGNWNRDNNYSVTCSSQNDAMTRCDWDARYGSPRLVQQLSSTACVNGRNWGYDSNRSLWVDRGCRARFAAQ